MDESTHPTDAPLREKADAIRQVASYRPGLSGAIVLASLLVGVLEGVGLGFILPIVTVVQEGPGASASGRAGIFVDLYAGLGLPFVLEYIVAGVCLVMAVRYGLGVVVAWMTAVLGAGYRRHLRLTGYERALDARTAYFDAYGSEELLNAILTQTDYASGVITKLVRVMKTVLVSSAYVVVALYLAPALTVLTGVVLVVFVVGSRYAFESGFGVGGRLARANERVQGTLQAGIQGIREVKLFSLEEELSGDFRRAVDRQTRTAIKQRRDRTALANLNQFFAAATVFGLVYLGVTSSSLSLPSLGVFLFAMFRLAPRISALNGLLYSIDNDLPHLIRTQDFVDRLARERESWGDESVPRPVERVEFRDVSFSYTTGDGAAITGVSFSVERGEFVAFVGPSGAGKSTLAMLLAGLYRPDAGEILADSTPIQDFSAAEWRSSVAVVRQDPHLFNETLRYNLTIGDREASREAIEAAAEVAQVTEFLSDLPNGYDTVLGDDGVRLSGGQRQRVALARALLTDADVLILDEATSELDSELEERVHDAIQRTDREYAVVAIAHRLSTVTGADVIHVVAEGEIVESGTHRELVGSGGRYADFYATQAEPTGHRGST